MENCSSATATTMKKKRTTKTTKSTTQKNKTCCDLISVDVDGKLPKGKIQLKCTKLVSASAQCPLSPPAAATLKENDYYCVLTYVYQKCLNLN